MKIKIIAKCLLQCCGGDSSNWMKIVEIKSSIIFFCSCKCCYKLRHSSNDVPGSYHTEWPQQAKTGNRYFPTILDSQSLVQWQVSVSCATTTGTCSGHLSSGAYRRLLVFLLCVVLNVLAPIEIQHFCIWIIRHFWCPLDKNTTKSSKTPVLQNVYGCLYIIHNRVLVAYPENKVLAHNRLHNFVWIMVTALAMKSSYNIGCIVAYLHNLDVVLGICRSLIFPSCGHSTQ